VAGVQGGDLLENVAVPRAGQVEVAVVGEVEHRGFVGGGRVVDVQFVVVVQAIGDLGVQVAGEAHFTVLGQIAQLHPTELVLDRFGFPHPLVETLGAAMQRVGTIVERYLVAFAVEFKGAASQAIAEAPDGRAEKRRAALVALHVVKPRTTSSSLPCLSGTFQRLQHAAVGDHRGLHAVAVAQDVCSTAVPSLVLPKGFCSLDKPPAWAPPLAISMESARPESRCRGCFMVELPFVVLVGIVLLICDMLSMRQRIYSR
jgi:hypothetical protein